MMQNSDRILKNQYAELLKGKSIALVGGDDEIDWAKVEFCDLVVRVNDHYIRQKHRIDIIYHSCGTDLNYDDLEPLKNLKFAWLQGMTLLFGAKEFDTIRNLCLGAKTPYGVYYNATAPCYNLIAELNPIPPEHAWLKNFSEQYNTYPFTGIVALRHIELMPCRYIYVDGMTLYTQNGITPIRYARHHTPNQLNYLQDLRKDERVTYSEKLNAVLDNLKLGQLEHD